MKHNLIKKNEIQLNMNKITKYENAIKHMIL